MKTCRRLILGIKPFYFPQEVSEWSGTMNGPPPSLIEVIGKHSPCCPSSPRHNSWFHMSPVGLDSLSITASHRIYKVFGMIHAFVNIAVLAQGWVGFPLVWPYFCARKDMMFNNRKQSGPISFSHKEETKLRRAIMVPDHSKNPRSGNSVAIVLSGWRDNVALEETTFVVLASGSENFR